MSNSDSFIEEVSEEVRRDRMFALWKRYGPYAIGALVAIVAAVGAVTWMEAREQAKAEAAGAALIAASIGGPEETARAMSVIADNAGSAGEAVLARLRAAGALSEAGDMAAAAEAYDAVAIDAEAGPLLRDFAAYRAVMMRGAAMAPSDFADALSPVVNGGGPFALLAREARGVALARAGAMEEAVEDLTAVLDAANAPDGLRSRAEAILVAIGAPPEARS